MASGWFVLTFSHPAALWAGRSRLRTTGQPPRPGFPHLDQPGKKRGRWEEGWGRGAMPASDHQQG